MAFPNLENRGPAFLRNFVEEIIKKETLFSIKIQHGKRKEYRTWYKGWPSSSSPGTVYTVIVTLLR
jgi:hypothetical protein